MRQIVTTTKFDKQVKKCKKRGYDMALLKAMMFDIASGNTLPPSARDHVLVGNYKGRRECHLKPDWLLIYKIQDQSGQTVEVHSINLASETVIFEATGTHSDLFKK